MTIRQFLSDNPHLLFYAELLGAFLITRIPLIGKYFRTLNTLFHESGHAIAAILTSGEVLRIELEHDTSGKAYTKSNSKVKALLVSFTGYPFAALISGILVALSVKQMDSAVFFILLCIALLNLALFVRNTYGIAWLVTFSGLVVFVFWSGSRLLSQVVALSVSLISFVESVRSTLTIVYLGFTHERKAGDATNLAKISRMPAAIWALLLGISVAVIVFYTLRGYFPDPLKPIVRS